MKKIRQFINYIEREFITQPDKQKHFTMGMIVALFASMVHPILMFPTAVGVGLLKELWDMRSTGFSWKDLVATAVGGGLVTLVEYIKLVDAV